MPFSATYCQRIRVTARGRRYGRKERYLVRTNFGRFRPRSAGVGWFRPPKFQYCFSRESGAIVRFVQTPAASFNKITRRKNRDWRRRLELVLRTAEHHAAFAVQRFLVRFRFRDETTHREEDSEDDGDAQYDDDERVAVYRHAIRVEDGDRNSGNVRRRVRVCSLVYVAYVGRRRVVGYVSRFVERRGAVSQRKAGQRRSCRWHFVAVSPPSRERRRVRCRPSTIAAATSRVVRWLSTGVRPRPSALQSHDTPRRVLHRWRRQLVSIAGPPSSLDKWSLVVFTPDTVLQ